MGRVILGRRKFKSLHVQVISGSDNLGFESFWVQYPGYLDSGHFESKLLSFKLKSI